MAYRPQVLVVNWGLHMLFRPRVQLCNLDRKVIGEKLNIPFQKEPCGDLVGYWTHVNCGIRFVTIDSYDTCFGRNKLKLSTIRGCARAARQYMQAYLLAHEEQLPNQKRAEFAADDLAKCVDPIPLAKIKEQRRKYKTHRSAADINKGQVKVIMATVALYNNLLHLKRG